MTTLPHPVVTLYLSILQGVTSRVTRVTTLLTFLYLSKKWKEWREGGQGFIPSIAERKRKQPIGVVTIVTGDVSPFQIDG